MRDERRELDVKKLSSELSRATMEDKRRRDVDEMKKRSILTAGSYDEFRHLVACAHDDQKAVSSKEMAKFGKPLEKKIFAGGYARSGNQDGRARAGRRRRRQQRKAAWPEEAAPAQQTYDAPPANLADFERRWRQARGNRAAQCAVVLSIGDAKNATNVFRIGTDDYLGGIIQALLDPSAKGSEHISACILGAISQTPRFDLSLNFLSSTEKAACASLIDALNDAGAQGAADLRSVYGC